MNTMTSLANKQKDIIYHSLTDNMKHNNNHRYQLQTSYTYLKDRDLKQYRTVINNSDCSQQEKIIFNNGYACTLGKPFRR